MARNMMAEVAAHSTGDSTHDIRMGRYPVKKGKVGMGLAKMTTLGPAYAMVMPSVAEAVGKQIEGA